MKFGGIYLYSIHHSGHGPEPKPEPERQKSAARTSKKKNLQSSWLTKPLRIHGMLDRPEFVFANFD